MGAVPNTYYDQVLQRISAPLTTENIRASHAWQVAEAGNARNNSWNTTEPEPGTSNYNSFGPDGSLHVKNYPTMAEGVDATVKTLLNGDYPGILAAFRRGNDGHAVCTAVDASVWGTHGAAATYARLYGAYSPSPAYRLLHLANPNMHGSDVRQVQEALTHHGAHLVVDGIFGARTDAAVRTFQSTHHLTADGIVGPHTRAALGLQ